MRHWLQLFRVPNLFTVPGDPLVGFLLAAGAATAGQAALDPRAAWAVLASLCLYAAGLAMNDLFDFAEDKRERPDRPLTSGAIPVGAAWAACAVLALAGIGAMGWVAGKSGIIAAIVLLGCVTLYNAGAKRLPIVGALVMGSCRGLSVLLGSVAFTGNILPIPVPVFFAGVIIALYIATVTNLARHETQASSPPLARILPVFPVLFGALLAFRFTGQLFTSYCTIIFAISLVFVSLEIGRLFHASAPPLPPVIGALIRVLLPLQAALCLFYPTAEARLVAICLAVLMPVARIVGRRFYAS